MIDTFLVTGGMGCIGAWVIYHLLKVDKNVVCFDISEDRHRWDWLMSAEEQSRITFIKGDLTDYKQVKAVFDSQGISHVIHLAALQIPMCRANPVLGAQVNVTGSINIFEAAVQSDIKHIAYASSIAVYGSVSEYPAGLIAHDAVKAPRTLYGAYKVCNEQTAQIYFNDKGLSSTALRPYTVYGVGRDQGLTSEPTSAMLAAAKGEDYSISFSGKMQFHFASDVAQQFIASAEQVSKNALVFNMGTPPIAVQDVADSIMKIKPNVTITVGDIILPFPEGFDSSAMNAHFDTVYETPLAEGIAKTIAHLERLL